MVHSVLARAKVRATEAARLCRGYHRRHPAKAVAAKAVAALVSAAVVAAKAAGIGTERRCR